MPDQALEIKPVSLEFAREFDRANGEEVFSDTQFRFWQLLPPEAMQRVRDLEARFEGGPHFCFAAFLGDDAVGLHQARQEERCVLHMGTSMVRPAYRRRGVYRALLRHVIAFAREQGFLAISSRHNASNNAVLIPKLQEGFLIEGFEISDVNGLMVRLVHHLSEPRRQMHLFRTGQAGVPPEAVGAIANLYRR